MASASDMIDAPQFGTATGDDGFTYLTVNMDGETVIFYDHGSILYYATDNKVYDYNMTGPEGGLTLPFIGTMFPDHIGWSANMSWGNDTVFGYTLSDALAGGDGHDEIHGMGGRDILHGYDHDDKL